MLGDRELVAFVLVGDLDRAQAFYEGVLGLSLIERTPLACVFRAQGTELRATLVEEHAPAAATVIGWKVPDIAAAVRELAAHGVAVRRYEGMEQDELGVWRAPGGAQVAWFGDPDGNTLSLTQR